MLFQAWSFMGFLFAVTRWPKFSIFALNIVDLYSNCLANGHLALNCLPGMLIYSCCGAIGAYCSLFVACFGVKGLIALFIDCKG